MTLTDGRKAAILQAALRIQRKNQNGVLMNKEKFFYELEVRSKILNEYILNNRFVERFNPEDIRWAVTAYVKYGGKRLRPAILLFSCGALGGDEQKAIPAAAAVEIFHTWTLVHDDIIDRDAVRRGRPTVHHHYYENSLADDIHSLSAEDASHYGVSIAILTGDIQHGWGISMMAELTSKYGIDPNITLDLIYELDTKVLNTLVEGEVLDIQYAYRDINSLSPEKIEDMLWKKTGALYEFCGRAGALIGAGDKDDPRIKAVADFAAKCGTAFQLQDDILGLVGNEKKLGKPVGSDLREGKRTLVVYRAFHNASETQRDKLIKILGNDKASEEDIKDTITLLGDLDGINYVAQRAQYLIESAIPLLDCLPVSKYRDLLYQWADFLIKREF